MGPAQPWEGPWRKEINLSWEVSELQGPPRGLDSWGSSAARLDWSELRPQDVELPMSFSVVDHQSHPGCSGVPLDPCWELLGVWTTWCWSLNAGLMLVKPMALTTELPSWPPQLWDFDEIL